MMINNHIHRQYVLERRTRKAVGIVTITDLLHLLLVPKPDVEGS